MTKDEAEKLAKIVSTADEGCDYCVGALVERLNKAALGYHFDITDQKWTDSDEPFYYAVITVTIR